MDTVSDGIVMGLPDNPNEWATAAIVVLWGLYQLLMKHKARKDVRKEGGKA